MTSSSVWVLKQLLCSYCVPSNQNELTHPVSVTVLRPTHVSAHLTLTASLGGVSGHLPWTEEETEAPEVE